METTARRALSELIDQLGTGTAAPPPPVVRAPAAGPVPAPVLPVAALPVEPLHVAAGPLDDGWRPTPPEALTLPAEWAPAAPVLPVQREPQPPATRPASVTVLPAGAASSILWRSRR